MSVINSIPLIAAGDDGYQISRSVRLRNSATGYFSRTIGATATNAKIGTLSMWVKRGGLTSATGNSQYLIQTGISATTDSGHFTMYFTTSDNLSLGQYSWAGYSTTQVFRDPSAWYHIVLSYNSTLASNNLTIYVNGVQIAVTSVVQNTNWAILSGTEAINIGRHTSVGRSFDGYLTEINLIDGQALTPSSFGETDAVTGVWQPKKYTGTYGTNGFYLNFSDNSAVTTSSNVGIGKDFSGNGNYWTSNSISVSAGATYDSMLDVPTPYADGGNGRGNYCVLNPLQDSATLANGNLDATSLSSYSGRKATMQLPTTGKWYWETTVSNTSTTAGNWFIFGMVTNSFALTSAAVGAANAISFGDRNDSVSGVFNETTTVFSSASINFATNDILQCAYDADSGKFWFGKNNSWYDSSGTTTGNPATGSNQTLTASAKEWFPFFQGNNTSSVANLNFGQRPFSYTPPTGFVALNTQNLPTPTISNGASYFNTVLYTGNAVQDRAITGFGFDLDLAWIKSRNNAGSHVLVNSVVGGDKQLFSNLTNAEQTNSDMTNGFTTGGILVGDNVTGTGSTNQNTYTYALWGWNAGGSTVTNTSGSISAQVRANATAGFSVVTFTAPASGNFSAGHGLGVTPGMVITKVRGRATNWITWHNRLNSGSPGTSYYVDLNLTGAQSSFASVWGSTGVTSSVIGMGVGASCAASDTIVAYCFAAVAGYSAFGSYTGNGAADGPFVFLNFRPRWVMIKRTDTAGENWLIWDSSRDTYNAGGLNLFPNLSNAENNNAPDFDFLSNGFKLRKSAAQHNASGGTYIYAAFAENPFKLSLAR